MIEDDDLEINNQNQDGDDSGWLMSYADMMTLIACFFILMMAFANYDPVGFNKKAKELSKSFNKGKWKSNDIKLTQVNEEIARHPQLKKMSKITLNDSELIISFSGSTLFEEGSYKMTKQVVSSIDLLVDIIRSKDTNFQIIIEGHTDPYEYQANQDLTSSWLLSSIRAAKVLERFEYLGFSPKSLVAIGKGESYPIADNIDSKGNRILKNNIQNRRVVIKVAKKQGSKKKVKLGLGVYIDE